MQVVMKKIPKISVLLPVYNGEKYLPEAIDSILKQTMSDFELMLIDDCSTDSTPDLLKAIKDPRLSVFKNEKNLGLTKTLNRGLDLARGEYIARMDADDLCFRQRFALQLECMDNNKQIAVCSGSFKKFGSAHSSVVKELDNDTLKGEILLRNPFTHPFIIFRTSYIKQNNIKYNEAYSSAQDYALWLYLAHEFNDCFFANVPYFLGLYRGHEVSISKQCTSAQQKNASRARLPYLMQLCDDELSETEIAIHDKLYERDYLNITPEKFLYAKNWLLRLRAKNLQKRVYPVNQFNRILDKKFFELCANAAYLGDWLIKQANKYQAYIQLNILPAGQDKISINMQRI